MQTGVASASIAGRGEIRYQTGQDQAGHGEQAWRAVTACCGRRRACCGLRRWRSSALPSGRAGPARFSAICARTAIGGKIHLVNPRQQTVYGERCFPSLRDIGEPVDHAMVIVPAANVADVLTDAEAAGVKSATDLRRRRSATARASRRGRAAPGSRIFSPPASCASAARTAWAPTATAKSCSPIRTPNCATCRQAPSPGFSSPAAPCSSG